MAKRLSEKQIEEIIEFFKSGRTIDELSRQFNCSKLTVSRNLKKILGELKYKDFINKSKSLKEKPETDKNQTNNFEKTNFDDEHFKTGSNDQ